MDKKPAIDPNDLHAAMMRAYEKSAAHFGMTVEEFRKSLEDMDVECE